MSALAVRRQCSLSLPFTKKASRPSSEESRSCGGFSPCSRSNGPSDRFAEKWWWDLSGHYQANRSIGEGAAEATATEDVETASGLAGIRYQPLRWATIRLAGSLVRQWSHGRVGNDFRRDSLTLGVTLGDTYTLF